VYGAADPFQLAEWEAVLDPSFVNVSGAPSLNVGPLVGVLISVVVEDETPTLDVGETLGWEAVSVEALTDCPTPTVLLA
jgi:hypothetical protein